MEEYKTGHEGKKLIITKLGQNQIYKTYEIVNAFDGKTYSDKLVEVRR